MTAHEIKGEGEQAQIDLEWFWIPDCKNKQNPINWLRRGSQLRANTRVRAGGQRRS